MAFGGVVLGSSISAIIGIFGLIIYTTMYAAFCLRRIDNSYVIGQEATSMLAMIPLVLAIVIVLSVLIGGLAFVLGRDSM